MISPDKCKNPDECENSEECNNETCKELVKTANHRTHTNYPGEPLNNEINIFEMLFGNLKDYVKEIIERLKKRFIKPKLVQEVVYVHQFKDYNNI